MNRYRPLIAILAHSGGQETINRNWPWYHKAEADLLLVGRENTEILWPDPLPNHDYFYIRSGVESGPVGDNHVRRFLDVLDHFLHGVDYERYTHICVTEYDAIFLKPIPEESLEFYYVLVTVINGYSQPGQEWAGSRFVHTPWLMSREMAQDVWRYGKRLLRAGLIERGFVDRFLGLLADLYELPILRAAAYSANSLDTPEFMAAAKQAVKDGAWHVHGVKTEQQLKGLTSVCTTTPES